MHKIKILGNDLKSLLLLKHLTMSQYQANIMCPPTFNFDTSYDYNGQFFDCGYHAIEVNRSEEVWDLIKSLPIKMRNFRAKRCIYFDEKLFERNYALSDLCDEELSNIYQKDPRIALKYFIENYVEKKFVNSFEQNKIWKNNFELDRDAYLVNIQPWLYPNEFMRSLNTSISYHFENFKNCDNDLAYPVSGGFGAIQESLREVLAQKIMHVSEYQLPLKSFDAIRDIDQIGKASGTLYVVPVDLFTLNNDVALEMVDTEYAIVDIEMQNTVEIDWTEILVADPDILIDRVSSPQYLSDGKRSRFLQVEKELEKGVCEDTFNSAVVNDTNKVITSIANTDSFVKNYKVKRVPFRRFNNEVCAAAVKDCISFIENEFENVIVLNRSALYRNFVDTYHDLKNAVHRKVRI